MQLQFWYVMPMGVDQENIFHDKSAMSASWIIVVDFYEERVADVEACILR